MVISCGSCGSIFQFDTSLLGGAAGARLRCRRCGGFIEVLNPKSVDRPQAVESSRAAAEDPSGRTQAAEESTVPPKADDQGEPARIPAFLAGSPDPPKVKSFKELKSEGLREGMTGGLAGRSGGFRDRRKNSLVAYAALGLGTLLLGLAGFGYLRLATGDRYVFERMEAHYQRNQESGSIFIVKGHIADTGGSPGKGRLLVHASLLDSDNKFIAKKTVRAGVTVSEEELLYRDKASIEQILSGNGTGEMKSSGISPSGSLPFMVVFFDVPNNVVNYALNAEKGE